MIGYVANNDVMDYMALGFDKKMQKQPEGDAMGVHSSGFTDNIQFDGQFESIDINKLSSNKLNGVIDLGNVKIDGKNGRIEVVDLNNKTIGIIGKF